MTFFTFVIRLLPRLALIYLLLMVGCFGMAARNYWVGIGCLLFAALALWDLLRWLGAFLIVYLRGPQIR